MLTSEAWQTSAPQTTPFLSVMWTLYLRTSSRQKATCRLNRCGQEKTFADGHADMNFPIKIIVNLRQPREICYFRLGQKRQFLPSRFQSNGRRGVLWTPSSGRKKFFKYVLVGVFLSCSRIKLNAHLELPGQNHTCHLSH